MDSDIFKSWFETVFLPAMRAGTTQPVALVSENCGAHDQLECNQVKFIALPPNCTSIYQPQDLGIIACLKRRYKRRLLDLVVSAFETTLGARAAAKRPPAGWSGRACVGCGGGARAAPHCPVVDGCGACRHGTGWRDCRGANRRGARR